MELLKRYRRVFMLLVAAVIAAVGFALHSKNKSNTGIGMENEKEARVSLNNLITNSMSNTPQTKKFDASIMRFMRQWGIKGGSFALMRNDSLLYAKGYGFANVEDSIECEVKHIFRVASVSKLITAVAIMKLQEGGALSTDDIVFGEEGILNDSTFLNYRDKKVKEITVEHLLRHTAGFSNPHGDAAFNMDLVAKWLERDLPLSMDDMVEYASKNRLRARPGGRFDYSNLGYIVLSKVIEKVSGLPYEQYVKDSVFAPMGIYDIHLAENYSTGFRENEVHYYEVKEAEPVPAFDGRDTLVMKSLGGNNVRGLYGAGGWVASPVELLKFIAAIDNCPIKEEFLKQESIEFMTLPSKKYRPAGWSSVTSREWQRTGSMAGTSAIIKLRKGEYTWVFISNSSSWNGPYLAKQMNRSITRAISRVKEWPKRDLMLLEQ